MQLCVYFVIVSHFFDSHAAQIMALKLSGEAHLLMIAAGPLMTDEDLLMVAGDHHVMVSTVEGLLQMTVADLLMIAEDPHQGAGGAHRQKGTEDPHQGAEEAHHLKDTEDLHQEAGEAHHLKDTEDPHQEAGGAHHLEDTEVHLQVVTVMMTGEVPRQTDVDHHQMVVADHPLMTGVAHRLTNADQGVPQPSERGHQMSK